MVRCLFFYPLIFAILAVITYGQVNYNNITLCTLPTGHPTLPILDTKLPTTDDAIAYTDFEELQNFANSCFTTSNDAICKGGLDYDNNNNQLSHQVIARQYQIIPNDINEPSPGVSGGFLEPVILLSDVDVDTAVLNVYRECQQQFMIRSLTTNPDDPTEKHNNNNKEIILSRCPTSTTTTQPTFQQDIYYTLILWDDVEMTIRNEYFSNINITTTQPVQQNTPTTFDCSPLTFQMECYNIFGEVMECHNNESVTCSDRSTLSADICYSQKIQKQKPIQYDVKLTDDDDDDNDSILDLTTWPVQLPLSSYDYTQRVYNDDINAIIINDITTQDNNNNCKCSYILTCNNNNEQDNNNNNDDNTFNHNNICSKQQIAEYCFDAEQTIIQNNNKIQCFALDNNDNELKYTNNNNIFTGCIPYYKAPVDFATLSLNFDFCLSTYTLCYDSNNAQTMQRYFTQHTDSNDNNIVHYVITDKNDIVELIENCKLNYCSSNGQNLQFHCLQVGFNGDNNALFYTQQQGQGQEDIQYNFTNTQCIQNNENFIQLVQEQCYVPVCLLNTTFINGINPYTGISDDDNSLNIPNYKNITNCFSNIINPQQQEQTNITFEELICRYSYDNINDDGNNDDNDNTSSFYYSNECLNLDIQYYGACVQRNIKNNGKWENIQDITLCQLNPSIYQKQQQQIQNIDNTYIEENNNFIVFNGDCTGPQYCESYCYKPEDSKQTQVILSIWDSLTNITLLTTTTPVIATLSSNVIDNNQTKKIDLINKLYPCNIDDQPLIATTNVNDIVKTNISDKYGFSELTCTSYNISRTYLNIQRHGDRLVMDTEQQSHFFTNDDINNNNNNCEYYCDYDVYGEIRKPNPLYPGQYITEIGIIRNVTDKCPFLLQHVKQMKEQEIDINNNNNSNFFLNIVNERCNDRCTLYSNHKDIIKYQVNQFGESYPVLRKKGSCRNNNFIHSPLVHNDDNNDTGIECDDTEWLDLCGCGWDETFDLNITTTMQQEQNQQQLTTTTTTTTNLQAFLQIANIWCQPLTTQTTTHSITPGEIPNQDIAISHCNINSFRPIESYCWLPFLTLQNPYQNKTTTLTAINYPIQQRQVYCTYNLTQTIVSDNFLRCNNDYVLKLVTQQQPWTPDITKCHITYKCLDLEQTQSDYELNGNQPRYKDCICPNIIDYIEEGDDENNNSQDTCKNLQDNFISHIDSPQQQQSGGDDDNNNKLIDPIALGLDRIYCHVEYNNNNDDTNIVYKVNDLSQCCQYHTNLMNIIENNINIDNQQSQTTTTSSSNDHQFFPITTYNDTIDGSACLCPCIQYEWKCTCHTELGSFGCHCNKPLEILLDSQQVKYNDLCPSLIDTLQQQQRQNDNDNNNARCTIYTMTYECWDYKKNEPTDDIDVCFDLYHYYPQDEYICNNNHPSDVGIGDINTTTSSSCQMTPPMCFNNNNMNNNIENGYDCNQCIDPNQQEQHNNNNNNIFISSTLPILDVNTFATERLLQCQTIYHYYSHINDTYIIDYIETPCPNEMINQYKYCISSQPDIIIERPQYNNTTTTILTSLPNYNQTQITIGDIVKFKWTYIGPRQEQQQTSSTTNDSLSFFEQYYFQFYFILENTDISAAAAATTATTESLLTTMKTNNLINGNINFDNNTNNNMTFILPKSITPTLPYKIKIVTELISKNNNNNNETNITPILHQHNLDINYFCDITQSKCQSYYLETFFTSFVQQCERQQDGRVINKAVINTITNNNTNTPPTTITSASSVPTCQCTYNTQYGEYCQYDSICAKDCSSNINNENGDGDDENDNFENINLNGHVLTSTLNYTTTLRNFVTNGFINEEAYCLLHSSTIPTAWPGSGGSGSNSQPPIWYQQLKQSKKLECQCDKQWYGPNCNECPRARIESYCTRQQYIPQYSSQQCQCICWFGHFGDKCQLQGGYGMINIKQNNNVFNNNPYIKLNMNYEYIYQQYIQKLQNIIIKQQTSMSVPDINVIQNILFSKTNIELIELLNFDQDFIGLINNRIVPLSNIILQNTQQLNNNNKQSYNFVELFYTIILVEIRLNNSNSNNNEYQYIYRINLMPDSNISSSSSSATRWIKFKEYFETRTGIFRSVDNNIKFTLQATAPTTNNNNNNKENIQQELNNDNKQQNILTLLFSTLSTKTTELLTKTMESFSAMTTLTSSVTDDISSNVSTIDDIDNKDDDNTPISPYDLESVYHQSAVVLTPLQSSDNNNNNTQITSNVIPNLEFLSNIATIGHYYDPICVETADDPNIQCHNNNNNNGNVNTTTTPINPYNEIQQETIRNQLNNNSSSSTTIIKNNTNEYIILLSQLKSPFLDCFASININNPLCVAQYTTNTPIDESGDHQDKLKKKSSSSLSLGAIIGIIIGSIIAFIIIVILLILWYLYHPFGKHRNDDNDDDNKCCHGICPKICQRQPKENEFAKADRERLENARKMRHMQPFPFQLENNNSKGKDNNNNNTNSTTDNNNNIWDHYRDHNKTKKRHDDKKTDNNDEEEEEKQLTAEELERQRQKAERRAARRLEKERKLIEMQNQQAINANSGVVMLNDNNNNNNNNNKQRRRGGAGGDNEQKLPYPWKKCVDQLGNIYYQNMATNETSFARPT